MTSKPTSIINLRILSGFAVFIAVLTVLISPVARAQQPDAVQQSAKSAAALAPIRALTTRSQNKKAPVVADAGNPLFLPAVNYFSGGASSLAVADVNGDGKLDLLVATAADSVFVEGAVVVLLGNGDGTFQPAAAYDSGGFNALSVAVADVNGDGKLDLVVANECSAVCGGPFPGQEGNVGVLFGNGDGTFQTAVAYDSGGIGSDSIAVADVNGDGKPDLVVANQCAKAQQCNVGTEGTVSVLLGNGDGTFQAAVAYNSGEDNADSVAVADLNGDGKQDLVVTNACMGGNSYNCGAPSVGVLLGNGDGTFQPAVVYDSGGASWVVVADLNGDTKPDLVVAGGGTCLLLGNGDGTFQAPMCDYTGGGTARSVAVADVNGDGKPDLLAANWYCCDVLSTAGVLLGNGDGTFEPALTYDTALGSVAIAAADLNGDGSPDLLLANNGGTVSVLLNNTGPHTPTTTTVASSANPAVVNQTVTYTVTVAGQSGEVVTGTVMFFDGSAFISTETLANGQATYSTSYGKRGAHAITASYSGDIHNSVSMSAALTQDIAVLPVPSTTVLTTSTSPSLIGQAVTFTASVTWQYGAAPNGELVTFYKGTTSLGSAVLAGGTASYTTSALTLGTHTIKATYAGDATFKTSSGTITQIVNGYATSTMLGSSLNPATYGQAVTLTATVTTSGPAPPTGKVNFVGDGFSLGPITLNSSGVATLTKHLNADSYALTAVYGGDASNTPSSSAILDQVVTQATSAATITSYPNPSTQGQAVTFSAKITSPTATPTGPVTFTTGKTVLGTVELSGGKAKLTVSTLPVGSTTVTVTYPWNSDIAESSASVTQVVQ